jgi:hypothetical protein
MASAPNIEGTDNQEVVTGGVFGQSFAAYLDANAPAYAPGIIYFSLTSNKLKVGGVSGYETVTSA